MIILLLLLLLIAGLYFTGSLVFAVLAGLGVLLFFVVTAARHKSGNTRHSTIIVLALIMIALASLPLLKKAEGEWVLCDVYTENVTLANPDIAYYDGYIVIATDGCEVFDVSVSYDYVPRRPAEAPLRAEAKGGVGGVLFVVYFDDVLVANTTSTTVDFVDFEWDGKIVTITVYSYVWVEKR